MREDVKNKINSSNNDEGFFNEKMCFFMSSIGIKPLTTHINSKKRIPVDVAQNPLINVLFILFITVVGYMRQEIIVRFENGGIVHTTHYPGRGAQQ